MAYFCMYERVKTTAFILVDMYERVKTTAFFGRYERVKPWHFLVDMYERVKTTDFF